MIILDIVSYEAQIIVQITFGRSRVGNTVATWGLAVTTPVSKIIRFLEFCCIIDIAKVKLFR